MRAPHHRFVRPPDGNKPKSAEEYLLEKRGADTSKKILDVSRIAVNVLTKPTDRRALTAKERRAALYHAQRLQPLMARRNEFVGKLLQSVVKSLEGPSPKGQGGRRLGQHALFANLLLHFCAGELGAIDQPQLTATELFAAAAAAGLPKVDWRSRGHQFDEWRKHRRAQLPKNPRELADGVRARLQQEAEAARKTEAARDLAFIDELRRTDFIAAVLGRDRSESAQAAEISNPKPD